MANNLFDGTREQMNKLLDCIEQHKSDPGALMPVMHEAQNIYGYLPSEVQTVIADKLNVPLAEVYGVATFYSQFSLQPKGKHQISVCLGTACYVKGSDKILEVLEKELKIKCGECTPDGKFSIDSCRCVGACGLAPVMIIDGEVYGKLTSGEVNGILEKYMKD
ncbi:MAG: NADH-quinone oxidoreductase subunit NuoE [Clostridia bacterium]|nr:NADH-quinone oxidoreductase subunit NuoE [Clostridia bacterium]